MIRPTLLVALGLMVQPSWAQFGAPTTTSPTAPTAAPSSSASTPSASSSKVARDANGAPMDCVIVVGNCSLYSSRTASTPERTLSAAELFKWYFIGQGGYTDSNEAASEKDRIELIDSNSIQSVGFVSGSDVIIQRPPTGPKGDPITRHALLAPRENDPTTLSNIYRKALVVTNLKKVDKNWKLQDMQGGRVVKTSDGKELVRVPALISPGADPSIESNVNITFDLYQQFFVWKERKVDGIDWLLLGGEFECTDAGDFTKFMKGWLPKDRTHAWNTTQAVEYDWETRETRATLASTPEEGAASILDDKKYAQLVADSGIKLAPPEHIMATEDMRVRGSWPLNMSRYPLIKVETLQGREENPLYQLGFIGGIYSSRGGQILSKEEAETANAKRNKTVRELYQLDLVILLDGTKSMERFRTPTLEAIKKVVKQVKSQAPSKEQVREEDLITRCAIGIYRNANDPASGPLASFDFLDFKRLDGESGSKNYAQIEEFLTKQKFDSNERTIREEALFDGLASAVTQAASGQSDNPNAYHMMLVVGDSGDKSKNTNAEQAIQLLNQHNYDLYTLSVPDLSEVSKRPDYQAFRGEMAHIASQLTLPKSIEKDPTSFDGTGRVLTLDQGEKAFISQINTAYLAAISSRNDVIGAILNPGQYPTNLAKYATDLLAKNGVDIKIMTAENQVQFFDEGWTSQRNKDGSYQWKVMQYVRYDYLSSYTNFLRPFREFAQSGDAAALMKADFVSKDKIDKLTTALTATFGIGTGQFSTTKLSQVIGDASSDLPVRSRLLQKTAAELIDYMQRNDPQTIKERARDLKQIGICYEILMAYQSDSPFELIHNADKFIDDVKPSLSSASAGRWEPRGLQKYTWIPTDYFP